jgi:hypothetical protein
MEEVKYPGYYYSSYEDAIGDICKNGDLTNFKILDKYREILEHVTPELGNQYLAYIRSMTSINDTDIAAYCSINDTVGGSIKVRYEDLYVSPSSLRYIFHAHLILTHMKSLKIYSTNIVEVGGGYGGLCLAVHYFANVYGLSINSYTIIDLPNPLKLQRLYLSKVSASLNVNFVDASNYGEQIGNKDLFLICNYCFSEISSENQKGYIQNLFPKVSHGFMTWNFIPVYNFKPDIKVEAEYPLTGKDNKYVYF